MADTSIDREQAATWAQERTLLRLLSETEDTNGILEKYLKAMLPDDVVKALGEQTTKLTRSVETQGDEIETGLETMSRQSTEDSKKMRYAMDGVRKEFASGLKTMGSHLSGADPGSVIGGLSQSLGYMKDAMSGLPGILPKVISGLSMLATIIGGAYARINEVNDGFLSLYTSGIRFSGGLTALNLAVGESGLTMGEFTGILNKHTSSFNVLGGQRVVALNKQFKELTKNGSSLLMTQAESQDAFLDYVDIQRQSGTLQRMSNKEIVEGSNDFLKSINDLSAASGRSREELLKGMKDATTSPAWQSFVATLSDDARKNLTASSTSLGAFGADIQKQMMDLIVSESTGGVSAMAKNNSALYDLALQTGNMPKLMNVIELAKAGKDTTAAMQEFQQSVSQSDYVQSGLMNTQAQFSTKAAAMRDEFGKLTLASSQIVSVAEQERIARQEGYKDLKDKREQSEKEAKRVSEANANMAVAMTSLNSSFTDLAIKFIPALTAVMDTLTGTINLVTGAFGLFKSGLEGITNFFSKTLGMGDVGGTAATAGVVGGGYMAARKMMGGSRFGIPGLQKLSMPGLSNLPGGEKAAAAMGRIGKGFSGLGEGIGKTISSIMGGIAKGFAAFGSPKVLMGLVGIAGLAGTIWIAGKSFQEFAKVSWEEMGKAGVAIVGLGLAAAAAGAVAPMVAAGGAALGAAILAIGAGVAGASWLMGNTLPTLADGIKSFGDINGPNLVEVGKGMVSLGAGLAAMGAGTVVDAFAGLASSIIGFFTGQEDPIDRLKRFGELSEPLGKSSKAMNEWATSFKGAIEVLNTAALNPSVDKTFDQIEKFLKVDQSGFFGGKPPIIEQIGGLAEVVGQLAEKTQTLQNASSARPAAAQPDQLQEKTMSYFAKQIQLTEAIRQELQFQTSTLMTISTDIAIGNTDIVRAVKEGNKVY